MDAAKAMSIKTAADAKKMSELTKQMSIDNKKKNGYLLMDLNSYSDSIIAQATGSS